MNNRVITTQSGIQIQVGRGGVGSRVLGNIAGYNPTPPATPVEAPQVVQTFNYQEFVDHYRLLHPPVVSERPQMKSLGIAPKKKFECRISNDGMTTYGQCGIRWFHHLSNHSRFVVEENSNTIVEWLLMMTDPKTIREGIAMTTTNGGQDPYWGPILQKAGFEAVTIAKNGNTDHKITLWTKVVRQMAVRKPRRRAA